MFGRCLISVAKSKNLFKVKPAAILLPYNIFVNNAYTKNGRRGTTLRAPRLPANREIEIIYDRIRLYKEFAGGKDYLQPQPKFPRKPPFPLQQQHMRRSATGRQ